MKRPTIILTGKAAGQWYIDTMNSNLPSSGKDEKAYHIIQTEFDPINALLPHKMPLAAMLLEPYFIKQEVEQTPFILANITLHEAVSLFTIKPKHFISIEDILDKEFDNKSNKVGLLGTSYTMANDYWKKTFPYLQFKLLPDELLSEIDDLRKAYFNNTNKALAINVFRQLQGIEVDYWILACTELALAYDDAGIELPMIHLPKLQCDYLIKATKV